jgi:hypothetical protein
MPLSPMDEYLAHQTPDTFDHVFTSDRNFYDRYYFNLHPCSDELFLIAGMGQYPNLEVTDAFVTVGHGDKQHTVRASRELGGDRLDTSVGPFSVEIIEGLRSLRVSCAPNDWGVSFDLVWRGSTPALEEPVTFTRRGARVTMHTSRYAQVGTWEGVLTVAGQTYDVTPDTWKGARDHSWGVRPVGESEPPGIGIKPYMSGEFGFFHHWLPMQFHDHMLKVQIDEDARGNRMVEEAVKIWNIGIDREMQLLGRPEVHVDFISGTREMERAEVTFGGGGPKVVNTPLRTVYLFAGSGYMFDGTWGHGVWQGPEPKVEGLVHEIGGPTERRAIAGLNETLCRFETDTGDVGYGMHENLILGTHHPSGFTSGDAVAS